MSLMRTHGPKADPAMVSSSSSSSLSRSSPLTDTAQCTLAANHRHDDRVGRLVAEQLVASVAALGYGGRGDVAALHVHCDNTVAW